MGAELLLVGRVYAFDQKQGVAEAVLFRGSRIACVGTMKECNGRAKADAPRLSVGRGSITPGLTDTAVHVLPFGRDLRIVNCSGSQTEEDCIARVADRARTVPAGDWILGRGWDEQRWPGRDLPRERALSFAVPEHPVLLARADGTAVWLNEKAIAAAGVNEFTPDPMGGRILHYGDGRPTGVLLDAAQQLARDVVAPPSPEERMATLEEALRELATLGLAEVQELGLDADGLDQYAKLAAAGRLPIRVRAVLDGAMPAADLARAMGVARALPAEGRLQARAVLLRLDGTVADGTAALEEPDLRGDGKGALLLAPEELGKRIRALHDGGFLPVIHAAGDRAVREALAAVGAVRKQLEEEKKDPKKLRVRLDGVELFAGNEGRLMKEYGVAVTMRTAETVARREAIAGRLGRGPRLEAMGPGRDVVRLAVPLALGSGLPEATPDPRAGMRLARTRRLPGQDAPAGAEQRLEAADALRAYTVRAAYAAAVEDRRGVLHEGADADVTLFADDVLAVSPEKLVDVKVLGTVVGGTFSYRAAEGIYEPGKHGKAEAE